MKKTKILQAFAYVLLHVATILVLLTSCAAPSSLIYTKTSTNSPTKSIKVTAISNSQSSVTTQQPPRSVTARVATITPTIPPALKVAANAEPIIFSGSNFSINQKCGHGDVIAVDGHILRATPRILKGNTNFIEKEPEGTRVDIIDCRLWMDDQGMDWLAVRTPQKKLGWMFVQPDMMAVTIYPVPSVPPKSITGIPANSSIAYVPRSDCQQQGSVSGAAVATSIGIDFIPVVGDAKGVGEAITGCDMVTGESLGNWRWFGLLGLVGLAEIAVLSHGDDAVHSVRAAENLSGSLRYGDEATMLALKNADSAADLANEMKRIGRSANAGEDAARHFDDAALLSDDAVRDLAKFEQPCSFQADTPVMTSVGLIPISQLAEGDRALAFDEESGKTGYYPISAVFSHLDQELITLQLADERIETTPDHLFRIQNGWVAAGDIQVGDEVISADGSSTPVESIQSRTQDQLMYNLSVAQAHTYFVGKGEWLVHNSCRQILRKNLISAGEVPNWGEDVPWQAHHVIPYEYESNAFVKRATDAGWDFNSATNGIALPSQEADAAALGVTRHSGSHPVYSSNVGRELDSLESAALTEGWSSSRSISELEKLISRLKASL